MAVTPQANLSLSTTVGFGVMQNWVWWSTPRSQNCSITRLGKDDQGPIPSLAAEQAA